MIELSETRLPEALFKERWVTFYVKEKRFYHFITSFVNPFFQEARNHDAAKSYYHCTTMENDEIVELHCMTTQFKLDKTLKPLFFEMLNNYLDCKTLTELAISEVSVNNLANKIGYGGYDYKQMKLVGLEEYSLSHIPFPRRKIGKDILADLAVKSSELIRCEIETFWAVPSTNNHVVEKVHGYIFILFYVFFEEEERIHDFSNWLIEKYTQDLKDIRLDLVDQIQLFGNQNSVNRPYNNWLQLNNHIFNQPGGLEFNLRRWMNELMVFKSGLDRDAKTWIIVAHICFTIYRQFGFNMRSMITLVEGLNQQNAYNSDQTTEVDG